MGQGKPSFGGFELVPSSWTICERMGEEWGGGRGEGGEGVLQCHVVGLSLCVGEQARIDHLVLVVHGVGSIHEAGFKTLVNCGKESLQPKRGRGGKIVRM